MMQFRESTLQYESYKRTNTAMQYFLSFSRNHKMASHAFGFLFEESQLVLRCGMLATTLNTQQNIWSIFARHNAEYEEIFAKHKQSMKRSKTASVRKKGGEKS